MFGVDGGWLRGLGLREISVRNLKYVKNMLEAFFNLGADKLSLFFAFFSGLRLYRLAWKRIFYFFFLIFE